jgi:serine/threonine protein kinase
MSPEQVRGTAAGPASDIFSLGCVLYEMISGRRTFPGQTAAETMSSILRDTPRDLVTAGAQPPKELERLVFSCLDKNCEQRLQSAHDLAFHMKALLHAPGDSQPPSGAIDSIAVLPFANASSDPDTEYLCDGITESILNSLARIAQLRVTPRSIVFRYKTREADPQTIGRDRLGGTPALAEIRFIIFRD